MYRLETNKSYEAGRLAAEIVKVENEIIFVTPLGRAIHFSTTANDASMWEIINPESHKPEGYFVVDLYTPAPCNRSSSAIVADAIESCLYMGGVIIGGSN